MIWGNFLMPTIRVSVLCAVSLSLVACGGAPSNVQKPVDLKSYKTEYSTKVVWSMSMGAMSAGGRLQVASSDDTLYMVSQSGNIAAVNKETGSKKWQKNLSIPISSGVGVGDSIIGLSTKDGEVLAISTNDGSVLWTVNIVGEVLSVPVIGHGMMFVQTGDGRLLGLSAKNGKILWTYERTVPSLSLRGSSGPILKQGLIVAGFASGHIVGLDARNGRVVWERVVAHPSGRSDIERLADVDAPPVIVGFMLFSVSYQGKLIAIDLRNGKLVWSRPMSAYLPFSADSENLYIANDRGVVFAIKQSTGADVWVQNGLKARVSAQPVPVSGAVIVGDIEGYIHLLNIKTGSIAGRRNLDGSKVIGHEISNNYVVTSTEQGKILAYTVEAL